MKKRRAAIVSVVVPTFGGGLGTRSPASAAKVGSDVPALTEEQQLNQFPAVNGASDKTATFLVLQADGRGVEDLSSKLSVLQTSSIQADNIDVNFGGAAARLRVDSHLVNAFETRSRCPLFTVPQTYDEWSCVKSIAPGWAEVACAFLPNRAAQALCMVTTASLKAAKCACWHCVAALPGVLGRDDVQK